MRFYRKTIVPLLSTTLAFIVFSAAEPLKAQEKEAPPHVSFTVTETDQFLADIIKIDIEIEKKHKDLGAALSAFDAAEKKVQDILKKNKIPQTDIRTSNFSSTPVARVFSSTYFIQGKIVVTLHDPSLGGALAQQISSIESDIKITDITFDYTNPEKIYDQLWSKASDRVKQKVSMYEAKYGVKLYPYKIIETHGSTYRPEILSLNDSFSGYENYSGKGFSGSEGEFSTFPIPWNNFNVTLLVEYTIR